MVLAKIRVDRLLVLGGLADAYSPWQRGLNENTNGLLRQFFPKGCDMRQFKTRHLRVAMYLPNHRPRKTLDFQKPQLLFAQHFP